DVKTGEHYWISGCRKDGSNALYSTNVEIDEDALEEYWINIRKKPGNIGVRQFRADGNYRK
ncbi:MAG TPA: 1-deoxy-D-xylulose-5-phosphate synthase, partial [Blastocatellia bacterium]